MQPLKSPKQNVAQKAVILIQVATTKVKETITEGLMARETPEEISKTLNKVIDTYCKQLDNVQLREETRAALVRSCRKWFYQLSETIKILNRNLAKQVSGFKADTFTVDIAALLKNTDKLRMSDIRGHLDKTSKGLAVINDYDKKLKIALKALAAEPPKIVKVAETGRRKGYTYQMSLRNRAEMTVRYEANLADLQRFIDEGVEFVWISSHPDASPRCAPHQGKLYSVNPGNRQGMHNGIPFTYLPDVLALNEGNSILNGYNCRHRAIPYQEGSAAPTYYSKEEIKKEYAIDQGQRRYENNIRQMKMEEKLLRQAGYAKEASLMRKKWRRATKKYEIYSLENERAFYRWRTIVSDDEQYYTPEIDLQKEAKSGIIDIRIDADAYTKERKEEAIFYNKRVDADALLRPVTEKLWTKLSAGEKKILHAYTVDSYDINKIARKGYTTENVKRLEAAIAKSKVPEDMWVKRLTSVSGFAKHLDVGLDTLKRSTLSDLRKKYIGLEIEDKGFVSTSTADDAEYLGEGNMRIEYRIYVPKGTEAVYSEPFSQYSMNDPDFRGINWDGKHRPVNSQGQTWVLNEAELLLNRGYHYRITDIKRKGNRLLVTEELFKKENNK